MDKLVIEKSMGLKGEVSVSGAKNSCLALIFSCLLAEGKHVLTNVPNLKDVQSACELLQALGCETSFKENRLEIFVSNKALTTAPYDIVRKMRASVLCLGPLLARFGSANVSLPGGCAIGSRPVDLHIEAMKLMGAEIEIEGGYIVATTDKEGLVGAKIFFEKPTVGGTENVMMAACLAGGQTIIENAAKEPEIVDLANYLKKMGAQIEGAGSSVLTVVGVSSLKASEHEVLPDRIEAGTLIMAGAITKGEVLVKNCIPQHLKALLAKLREAGLYVEVFENAVKVKSQGFFGVDISTAPHPGFATDLQAQFMALMTQAEGTSLIAENIFENRFMHVEELKRMNADISLKSRVALVRGNPGGLKGAPVMATDLRASASLVLAGLVSEGQTEVKRIYHLERGYENLHLKLQSLGAKIKKIAE